MEMVIEVDNDIKNGRTSKIMTVSCPVRSV